MAAPDSTGFWMSLTALVFSGGSLWISFCAFRSTRSYQHFEYTPRLQISGGAVYFGANTAPSYGFKGGLQNKGAKPVRIRRLLMDVGHCALAVAYAAWMTAVIVEFVRGGHTDPRSVFRPAMKRFWPSCQDMPLLCEGRDDSRPVGGHFLRSTSQ